MTPLGENCDGRRVARVHGVPPYTSRCVSVNFALFIYKSSCSSYHKKVDLSNIFCENVGFLRKKVIFGQCLYNFYWFWRKKQPLHSYTAVALKLSILIQGLFVCADDAENAVDNEDNAHCHDYVVKRISKRKSESHYYRKHGEKHSEEGFSLLL